MTPNLAIPHAPEHTPRPPAPTNGPWWASLLGAYGPYAFGGVLVLAIWYVVVAPHIRMLSESHDKQQSKLAASFELLAVKIENQTLAVDRLTNRLTMERRP
jgi:hypothetical protein